MIREEKRNFAFGFLNFWWSNIFVKMSQDNLFRDVREKKYIFFKHILYEKCNLKVINEVKV